MRRTGRCLTSKLAPVVLALLVASACAPAQQPLTIEIELRASAGTICRIFWAKDYQFTAAQSVSAPLRHAPDEFQIVRLALPAVPGPGIRLDPIETPGTVAIRRLDVLGAGSELRARVNPATMLPAHNIASVRTSDGATEIVSIPNGAPFLYLAVDALETRAGPRALTAVTPLSLPLVAALVILLLFACSAVVVRRALSNRPTTRAFAAATVWLAALMSLVFAAKVLLIARYPAPVPFYDQWAGEGYPFYLAFDEGWLSWPMMFMVHNEHRWFFSRVLSLGLLSLNHQWDPLLQQVVNAALHAFTAGLVALIVSETFDRRRLPMAVLVCALVFAPPFAWENTLFGGASQFYFLALFSILAFWLVLSHRAGSVAWTLGWICAACSLFTLAAGLLTPLCLVIASFRGFHTRADGSFRRQLLNVGAGAAVLLIGYAGTASTLGHSPSLHAATPGEFVRALGAALAWPWIGAPLRAVWSWLPLAAVLAYAARTRTFSRPLQLGAILGLWVVLQAAAISYGRGVHGAAPTSRYMDVLSWSLLANGVALAVAFDAAGSNTSRRRLVGVACAGWLAIQTLGIVALCRVEFSQLASRQPWFTAHVQNVARFVFVDDDVAAFVAKRPPDQIPYPVPSMLANAWLRHPYIRSILPAAIREPFHVMGRDRAATAFAVNAFVSGRPDGFRRGWGSFTGSGRSTTGRFESEPLGPCRHGARLEIQLAGGIDDEREYVAIKDLASGVEVPLRARGSDVGGWHRATAPCPAGQFSIVAHDLSPASWIGFTEPVEIGTLSALAQVLLARAPWLFVLSGALMAAAAFASVAASRRHERAE